MSDTPRGRVTNVHSPVGVLIRVKNGLATMIFCRVSNSLEQGVVNGTNCSHYSNTTHYEKCYHNLGHYVRQAI